MESERWKTKYEQLNQRSRWYSSQLWYVAFAYMALVGVGAEKLINLPDLQRGIGFIVLSIFSLAVFVHVTEIKHYERRAVVAMRKLEEGDNLSKGGSPWTLSFYSYYAFLLIILTFVFIEYGVFSVGKFLKLSTLWGITIVLLAFFGLSFYFAIIIKKTVRLNKPLLKVLQGEKEKDAESIAEMLPKEVKVSPKG